MRKMLPSWAAMLVASLTLVLAGFLAIPSVSAETATERSSSLELFLDVYSMTRVTYVDSLDSAELVEAALQGMLQSLDPNSVLLTPSEFENLQIQLQGSFEGVGITIGQREGWLTVISPLEGTPAHRAGMRGGDRIVEIDGETTEGITTQDAVSKIRGPDGSLVELTVIRAGVRDSLLFEIERGVIDYPSVSSAFMMEDSVAYVRLSRFSTESARDLYRAIDSLRAQGATDLILDLRGNSGGLFLPAIEVSDIFLPAGAPVVSTRGKAVGERSYSAQRGVLFDGDLVVLVDGGSASSAEIVAGALKDNGRATLVGMRTFGKGSVQNLSDLGEYPGLGHYAVKLTTARYYTPSGHSIDRTMRDDFLDPDAEETWGISPDVEVETPEVSGGLMLEMEREALFFKFARDYTADHDIPDGFWPDGQVMEDFEEFLDSEGFQYELTELEQSLSYVERALFREIALRMWSMEAYYRAVSPHDDYIQTALDILGGRS